MYIDKTDLEKHIQEDLLLGLDFTGSDEIIVTACAQAVGQLKSHLSARYAIAEELAKTGAAREELLLMIAKDLAIYHIWTYNDATSIPASRKERYTAAIDYLRAANMGSVAVNIDPATVTFSPVGYGSNLKRVNHY
ncbi:MAG: DUF1320 family protein [Methylobacter sp.]|nr:DUF1320 family protein [Methylobacter sp.]